MPAVKASPAPVVSTTAPTVRAGSDRICPATRASAPPAPRVSTTAAEGAKRTSASSDGSTPRARRSSSLALTTEARDDSHETASSKDAASAHLCRRTFRSTDSAIPLLAASATSSFAASARGPPSSAPLLAWSSLAPPSGSPSARRTAPRESSFSAPPA